MRIGRRSPRRSPSPGQRDAGLAGLAGRLAELDTLDDRLAAWTARHDATALAARLQESGVPASRVQTPEQRIEEDPATAAWGLWPEVQHPLMGAVRVDGLPLRLSETDWEIARGAPLLGQHNDVVFGDLLGVDRAERDQLRAAGVI